MAYTELEFAELMVEKLQEALLENPIAQTVTVDGQTVSYADAVARLKGFQAIVNQANGSTVRVSQIDLGGY